MLEHTDYAEIFRESMPNEYTSPVDKHPELFVHKFQRCQCVPRQMGIKVTNCHNVSHEKEYWITLTFDTRKLGQIINNDLARMDMVVDERDTFFRTIAPKDGHASKTEPCRADDTVGTIRTVLCFFLAREDT